VPERAVPKTAGLSREIHPDLGGRVALVAGASRGIGRACAIGLARAGADVWLLGRSREPLEQVAAEIAEHCTGPGVRTLCADVTDASQLDEAFAAIGRLDILVHSAGGNIPEPFLEVSEANLDEIVQLNVKGAFLVVQRAARLMTRAGGGSIVVISSQMGHVGAPRRSVYCATKHAVEGLVKAVAVELAPQQVRVNSVAPTFVLTPLTAPFLDDAEFHADVLARIPLGRIGVPEDVVGAVLFLASDAASLITGSSLLVDGGWTAR
jgi:NAD(P)-dependent dehydrogenase (short-subunit alcohol dehydrogenase family)